MHPDWGLINGLRSGLAEAGISTLSVQMPVLSADAPREQYATLFPEANARLAAAVAYLRERGIERIAIVSHSMGASMADAYLSSPSAVRLAAWVPVGMLSAFGSRPNIPVLDVIAERDFAQVLDVAPKRAATLPRDDCSKQRVIAGTDHYMENRQKELVAAIAPFLARALRGQMLTALARESLPIGSLAQPIVHRDPIGTVRRRFDPDFVGAERVEGAQVGVEISRVGGARFGCLGSRCPRIPSASRPCAQALQCS